MSVRANFIGTNIDSPKAQHTCFHTNSPTVKANKMHITINQKCHFTAQFFNCIFPIVSNVSTTTYVVAHVKYYYEH